jgi:hypothetical protein
MTDKSPAPFETVPATPEAIKAAEEEVRRGLADGRYKNFVPRVTDRMLPIGLQKVLDNRVTHGTAIIEFKAK